MLIIIIMKVMNKWVQQYDEKKWNETKWYVNALNF